MKRILLTLCMFLPLSMVFAVEPFSKVELNNNVQDEVFYCISGETSYNLGSSSSGVGGIYTIKPTIPIGSTVEWEIQGTRGYVYPISDGSACSINIYNAGSYRLSCVITTSNGEVYNPAIYITVMP